ncbi:MAG: hypothetical protein CMO21_18875 [Thioclava sp.]|nr:hypothetical protein [Thioclava sp.]
MDLAEYIIMGVLTLLSGGAAVAAYVLRATLSEPAKMTEEDLRALEACDLPEPRCIKIDGQLKAPRTRLTPQPTGPNRRLCLTGPRRTKKARRPV